MNSVILIGRLTRDPELKFGQSGKAYCRFSIAVDKNFKDDKGSADFINCVAFANTAEFIGEYFKKGRKIAISGRLNSSSYESDGKKIYSLAVLVDNVEFADSKPSDNNSYKNEKTTNVTPLVEEESTSIDLNDDDFPF